MTKDEILNALIKWATGVGTLNGVYTLSTSQGRELRDLVQCAMAAVKPTQKEASNRPRSSGPSAMTIDLGNAVMVRGDTMKRIADAIKLAQQSEVTRVKDPGSTWDLGTWRVDTETSGHFYMHPNYYGRTYGG